jgi:predicted ester cyclase
LTVKVRNAGGNEKWLLRVRQRKQTGWCCCPTSRRSGTLDTIDGLVSPDYVNNAATTEEYRHGGARHIWEWILSVFPDHRFDVEHIAADGETVAVLGTMVGTHEGEFMGIAPTGRRVVSPQSHWFRVEQGKPTEHQAVRDDLGMLQQLGALTS